MRRDSGCHLLPACDLLRGLHRESFVCRACRRRQGKEAISRWRTLKHGSAMVPQSGPGDSTQAADRLGYPPPDRLASKPSLDSVAELVSEDDVDGPTAQENASKLSDSQGEVRTLAVCEVRLGCTRPHASRVCAVLTCMLCC